MRRSLLVTCVLAGSGCATSLSGFQPAHVAAQGHVTAEVGMDVSAPTGTLSRAWDSAQTLADVAQRDNRALTDPERRQIIEAGANVAMAPPAVVVHVGGTFVPVPLWEVGLRYASGAWRVGVRHQLLDQERHGLDLSAGLGFSYFSYSFPVDKIIDVLKLDDFERWSVDVPLLIGKHGSWYRLWAGPRILLSRFSTALTLNLPAAAGSPAQALVASVEGTTAFWGGQGGLAIGYRHIFLGFELTIVRLVSHPRLELAGVTQDVDLGGLVIYPGIALMGEF